ncbi:MAG TPA: BREX-3 system phosphatase PglZ, partial [Pirellulaceae bacterium]|nr:BREX-3 system phosphatase PglZ [Pirellulaceae bacterium]
MSWRDRILDEFVPQVSKLTLVADPDNLLTEEKLSLELRNRGFDLIEFTDSVEFRFAYESRYRSLWDKGEHTDLVVILRLEDSELHSLPYDLLTSGRLLGFNLGELFPNLSYPVVELLDRSWLDALFSAQSAIGSDRLGDNATKDFVLRHVFGIAGELIRDEVELLRTLLRVHYGSLQIPEILAERLVRTLRANKAFQPWPLDQMVSDANKFYEFLQKCWPAFLKRFISPEQVVETPGDYSQSDGRPAELPFDHQDIRVYIDNLFLEGKLSPIAIGDVDSNAPSWIRVGIISDTTENERNRITGLFELV